MTRLEELHKAAQEAAEAGTKILKKSQMAFDFTTTNPHHVGYTRTNVRGTVSSVRAKGATSAKHNSKPTVNRMAKEIQSGNFDYHENESHEDTCDACGKPERDVREVFDKDNGGSTLYGYVCDDCIDEAHRQANAAMATPREPTPTTPDPDRILHGEGRSAIKQAYVDKVSAEIKRIKALDRPALLREIQFASRLDTMHMRSEATTDLRMHALHNRYSGPRLESYYNYANANPKIKLPLI